MSDNLLTTKAYSSVGLPTVKCDAEQTGETRYTQSDKDPRIKCAIINSTFNPNVTVWKTQHQCVSNENVSFFSESRKIPNERKAGEIFIKSLLGGKYHDNRGHWSPLESVSITFNFIGFSHRVMQQAVRSRLVSPAVQSFRYTGERIATAYDQYHEGLISVDNFVEQFYYIRPTGFYADRHGKKYEFSKFDREKRIKYFLNSLIAYSESFNDGMPEEMNAGILGMDARQNFVITFNARSICAFFDRRSKSDAQLEIQEMCNLMIPLFREWMPELAEWYYINRWKKARLNP